MIDEDGFRPNIGIILTNAHGQVFWGRRSGQNAWQFPQGGMKPSETPEETLYRELYEEVGLKPDEVRIIACTKGWLKYKIPVSLRRKHSYPVCIGQKQRWFLLQLMCNQDRVRIDASATPEFDEWRWVHYWYPLQRVVSFKRRVYRRAMEELAEDYALLKGRAALTEKQQSVLRKHR